MPDSKTKEERDLDKLLAEAKGRYGARCLWNTPEHVAISVLTERLRTYGDLAACRLADRIDEASASRGEAIRARR